MAGPNGRVVQPLGFNPTQDIFPPLLGGVTVPSVTVVAGEVTVSPPVLGGVTVSAPVIASVVSPPALGGATAYTPTVSAAYTVTTDAPVAASAVAELFVYLSQNDVSGRVVRSLGLPEYQLVGPDVVGGSAVPEPQLTWPLTVTPDLFGGSTVPGPFLDPAVQVPLVGSGATVHGPTLTTTATVTAGTPAGGTGVSEPFVRTAGNAVTGRVVTSLGLPEYQLLQPSAFGGSVVYGPAASSDVTVSVGGLGPAAALVEPFVRLSQNDVVRRVVSSLGLPEYQLLSPPLVGGSVVNEPLVGENTDRVVPVAWTPSTSVPSPASVLADLVVSPPRVGPDNSVPSPTVASETVLVLSSWGGLSGVYAASVHEGTPSRIFTGFDRESGSAGPYGEITRHRKSFTLVRRDGEWSKQISPSDDFLRGCERVLRGGYENEVSEAEADEIADAGYGVEIRYV